MTCDTVRAIVTGSLLVEDAGGLSLLRAHHDACQECHDSIDAFLEDEKLLREAAGREVAGRILHETSRRRFRKALLGWAAGVAACVIAVSLVVPKRHSPVPEGWELEGQPLLSSHISAKNSVRLSRSGRVYARLTAAKVAVLGEDRLHVMAGRVDVAVVPGQGSFSVTTPNSRVAVVGTEFFVSVEYPTWERGAMMNGSFWKGLAAGVVTTVIVYSGKVVFSSEATSREVAAGQVSTARQGQAPTPAMALADRVRDLEQELALAKDETRTAQTACDEARAKAERLEATLRKEGDESAARGEADTGRSSQGADEHTRNLMQSIEVGKELPADVVEALELDANQAALVNASLIAEGPRLYGALRAIATDRNPDVVLPAEDDSGLILAVVGSAVGTDFPKVNKILNDKEFQLHKKVVYLEDVLGPDSAVVRITDSLDQIRAQTFASIDSVLPVERRAKVRDFLNRNFNFGGAVWNFPENLKTRRQN